MAGRKTKIGILGGLVLFGIAVAIPTGLTSLIFSGVAVIGIAVLLIVSVVR